MEITSEEQNKVKTMKRTEDSLRDPWYNIKHTNIWMIGVPEEEEKGKGIEKILRLRKRDYSWKFPQHGKGNSQSSPRVTKSPIQDKPKEIPRHILIKLIETKTQRLLKAEREKQQVTYMETPYT